ncbi:amidase [Deinococcus maricopensis]|uniref:Amidase n=1 Tax=Deinococcus maricopensis (strain DSM 21211 / LMG 22137 / NRRL B-23946 / LB-34) TaxID=709986 RepID=E8U9Z2_DEIML|nr:amidase [Deinococcus maricopensis]ADV67881.1 Amidase [Deinococcus maricopensis DSM 21211]
MTNDVFGAWAYRPATPLRGAPGGPLADLTFSAKDLYGVPGWPLGGSSRAALPAVAPSPLVAHLRALGATLVGKTHLHEVALGVTGANAFGGTRNPLDATRVAGGSSSGAAVSVATGEVDFALGTDTGGSIRVPAAWCGVVGFKPTKGHAAWPTDGVLPLSLTCDHAGPLARDVQVVARVHGALTDQVITPRAWAGVRVGVWDVPGWVTPEVWATVEREVARLTALGASVVRVPFPEVLDAYSPIVLSEAARVHAGALASAAPGFTPATEANLRAGAQLTDADITAARARRGAYQQQLADTFGAVDVLLGPAVPDIAPHPDQEDLHVTEGTVPVRRAVLRLTAPWSLLGAPTLSLPRPLGALSVGVQLVAPCDQDEWLLGLALALDTRS